MNKLSIVALLSVLTMPAFAENTDVSDVAYTAVAPTPEETVALPTTDAVTPVQASGDVVVSSRKGSFLDGVQIGVGISGTGGLNAFIGYANKNFDSFWAKRLGVRFDYATTKPIKSTINTAIDKVMGDGTEIGNGLSISGGEMSAKHLAAMIDFYPFGDAWLLGGWRLSGGYYMGDMNLSANIAGKLDGVSGDVFQFNLNGTQFRYLGNSVHGTAQLDWDYRGPYLGTGFDIGLFAGLKIYVDAGVVFTNRAAQLGLNVPFVGLEINQNGVWQNVIDNDLQSTVDGVVSETLSDAQSELNDAKFYPIVKIGFMYRF